MVRRSGRSILVSAACFGFSAAQLWAASYLTTAGAPGQAWRLEGGLGSLLLLAGLVTAGTGAWAGFTARTRK